MSDAGAENRNAFMAWLEAGVARIKSLEGKIRAAVQADDDAAYKALLLEKAEFLADLSENGARYLGALPEGAAAFAQERLEDFSAGASRALELDSYFYMSALLYPEEHQEGQPNDLEAFAGSLRGMLG